MLKSTERGQERALPRGEGDVPEAAPLGGPGTSGIRSSASRTAGVVGLCLLVAAGGVWALRKRAAVGAGVASRSSAGPPAVPVLAGIVARRDVPIYLDGLGTVQA